MCDTQHSTILLFTQIHNTARYFCSHRYTAQHDTSVHTDTQHRTILLFTQIHNTARYFCSHRYTTQHDTSVHTDTQHRTILLFTQIHNTTRYFCSHRYTTQHDTSVHTDTLLILTLGTRPKMSDIFPCVTDVRSLCGQTALTITLRNSSNVICEVCTNRTRQFRLFVLNPLHACPRHGSWANVYMTKSCKGKHRDPDALKLGLVS
jgi:hypothetical protein